MTKRWRFALVAAVLGALLPILTSGTASAVPTVTSFTPTSGGAGTSVTITGSNFAPASTVTLNGKAVTVSSINSTTITFTIPASASSGQIKVTDTTGSGTAPGTFTVTAGVCCSRTVTPAASFPVNGTALDPSSALNVSLYRQGDFIARLATTTTDATGGFSLASLTLPPEVSGGTYDLLAATKEKAASVTITVQASWLAPMGTARARNAQRFESLLGYGNVGELDVDWVAQATNAWLRPIVVAGLVIVRDGGDVLALNAATGVKAWRSTVGSDSFDAIAALGNTVYASTGTAVRALAVSNGATQWTSTCSACPSGTVFDNVSAADGIVVANTGQTIRAFNATNGAYLWTGTPPNSQPYSDVSPSIVGGTVLVRSFSLPSYVTAYDATTGAHKWSRETSNTRWASELHTTATLAGAAFATNASGSPTALSLHQGGDVWTRGDITGTLLGSNAVAEGVALYGSSSVLYALSTTDGSTRWSLPLGGLGSTYANGVFYVVTSDSAIRAIDASSGQVLAKYGVRARYLEPPVPAGGSLYITADQGVVALSLPAANR